MWQRLRPPHSVRLHELTHDQAHPLRVPLVVKPGEANPTGYLAEIADLTADQNGRRTQPAQGLDRAPRSARRMQRLIELDRTTLKRANDDAKQGGAVELQHGAACGERLEERDRVLAQVERETAVLVGGEVGDLGRYCGRVPSPGLTTSGTGSGWAWSWHSSWSRTDRVVTGGAATWPWSRPAARR